MTPLDLLCSIPFHEADPARRARILSRLADTELFAALVEEPVADRAELQIFPLEDGPAALACDSEERLAGFIGGPVAYVGLPGRVLAAALVAEGRGLLVNPGQPSQMLLDAAALAWLGRALEAEPSLAPDEAPVAMRQPRPEAVEILAEPVSLRLGDMGGLVESAALVAAEWADGRANHTLILKGVGESHRNAVAKAFAELLAFLPEIPGGTDLAFSDASHPALALVLESPPLDEPAPAPRRDPNAPPRLR
ncbi:MAG TPA: SseB family protein [Paracoccus sp. (in: a-proteobacteria)]|uniref:SseB family protein n=1 Tax=Paracoccus sp. TaxID=267 RepID=UPI002CFD743E|nr:SseB family protein [Paracoccus sp. (in: a-proteobacteria)]HWL58593.1 SseB family protein [Paracoccus sp. (in: a-proteobacteria)]